MTSPGLEQVNAVIEQASASQRHAASPDKSAWVSANAGAGKTRVLVDRVTGLLLAGTPPGRILCLTFTNAAAAQMANRLFERLAGWAVLDDAALAKQIDALPELGSGQGELVSRARSLFARALETPGGLKIQTIHAFCERLLQRFPLEAGVTAGFAILDERERRELMQDAQREVLTTAMQEKDGPLDKAFNTIAGLVAESTLEELVNTMANHRAFKAFLALPGDEQNENFVKLAASWGISCTDTPERLIESFDFDTDAYRRAADVLVNGSISDNKKAKLVLQAVAAKTPEKRFELLKGVFLTQKNLPLANLMTKKLRENFPAIQEFMQNEQIRYVELSAKIKAGTLIAANKALLQLGSAVIRRFEQLKHARSRLDFNDIITRARNLLSRSADAAWVLYKLDGGIDHVLIDEAQDTSPDQWKIIQHLTTEFFAGEGAAQQTRTVFAVGDEKQSIFSFQGADPEKFGEMQNWFTRRAMGSLVNVPLEVSFRSTPAVLHGVDLVFADDMPRKGLSWSTAPVHHIPSRSGPGLVEIRPSVAAMEKVEEKPFPAPVDIPAKHDPALVVAEQIAARIERWLKAKKTLPARQRPVRPGDILILVRNRGIFADAMVRALKRKNIPVAGADRMRLNEQIAVHDLVALGKFALQPEDDLNLAALLKSPLLGLDEDELFRLAATRKTSLWQALQFSETGEVFNRAKTRLLRWMGLAAHLRPFEFFSAILDGEGLRTGMLERLGVEAADPIDEFLAQCLNYEQGNSVSLQGFISWVLSGDIQIKRDMEHGKNEVRVMTVHGAKGLEANIVFLPDSCAVPGTRHIPKLLDLPLDKGGIFPLPLWPVSKDTSRELLAAAYDLAASKAREEYNRLLYVAMTRARDELYIYGFEGKGGPPEDCWHQMVLKALKPVSEEIISPHGDGAEYWRMQISSPPAESDREAVFDHSSKAAQLPEWAQKPPRREKPPAAPLSPSRLAAAEFGGNTLSSPAVLPPFTNESPQRFRRGTIIHTLLEFLPQIAADERAGRARAWIAAGGNPLPQGMADEIIAEVTAILEDKRFAAYFGPGSCAEAPFAALWPDIQGDGETGKMFGQIDRIAVLEDEILILDYKTNRPPPENISDVPEIYIRQMTAYASALRQMFPGKRIRCALLWTDVPRLMELPGELLDLP